MYLKLARLNFSVFLSFFNMFFKAKSWVKGNTQVLEYIHIINCLPIYWDIGAILQYVPLGEKHGYSFF